MKTTWGVTIIENHYSKGNLIGFTVSVDNGDTQYMTIEEYDKLLRNKVKVWKKKTDS